MSGASETVQAQSSLRGSRTRLSAPESNPCQEQPASSGSSDEPRRPINDAIERNPDAHQEVPQDAIHMDANPLTGAIAADATMTMSTAVMSISATIS